MNIWCFEKFYFIFAVLLEKATCEERDLPAKQSVRLMSDRGRNPASPLFDRLFLFFIPYWGIPRTIALLGVVILEVYRLIGNE